MVSKLQILRNFFTYSLGSLILKSIFAIIGFFAISFLTPSEYGLFSLINTFINIFPIFLNLGLRQAFSLDFFHTDNVGRKKILNDIISLYLILSLPILFFTFINIQLINKYIFLNQANYYILYCVLLTCFLHFFVETLFIVLRYQLKILHLSIIQLSMAVINLIMTGILVCLFKLKILGFLLANFVSMFSIYFYGLYLFRRKVGFINFDILKNQVKIFYYLKLGFPYIPSILFNWSMSFIDRWILSRYSTLHEVGIYSLADSFGQLYQMLIIIPMTGSYLPYIFQKFGENKKQINEIDKWNQSNMFKSMIFIFLLISTGFLLFKNFLYLIFPQKYYKSIEFIWFILIQQIIFMGTYFANCYLQFFKKTYIFSGLIVFSSIINIVLNFLLIPYFFIFGAIISTTVSYVIYLISILVVTSKLKGRIKI